MKFLKSILSKATFVLMVTALSAVGVKAMGTLEPQGEPGDDTHKSLKDLLDKLTDFNNTPAATSSPFVTPGAVVASFPTLNEIYALLENEDADLIPSNIAQGVTIFGVDGTLVGGSAPSLQWSADSPDSELYQAISYCSNLDESSNTDWRLPTIPELYTGYHDGTLPDFASQPYWAFDPVDPLGSSGTYYQINPSNGDFSTAGNVTGDFVCVRDVDVD